MTTELTADEPTADECRRVAAHMRRSAFNPVWLDEEADRLDAAAADDAEVQRLAKAYAIAFDDAMEAGSGRRPARSAALRAVRAALIPDGAEVVTSAWKADMQAMLDAQLAEDKLRATGGMVLTADEVADVQALASMLQPISFGIEANARLVERFRARFAGQPAEQAAPRDFVPNARHKNRDGRSVVVPGGSECPWIGDRCETCQPAPTVPRTWPSLDKVPHDVKVTDREGDEYWFNGTWWERGGTADCVIRSPEDLDHFAPFTEVLGGAL